MRILIGLALLSAAALALSVVTCSTKTIRSDGK